MSEQIRQISDDFWNIRGDFKIGGILNIGTHASLVRRANGKFVLLDAYTLQGEVKEGVDAISKNGGDIEAIINLHPFHTIHVQKVHEQFPNAKLYGTQRHIEKFPDLRWQPELTESENVRSCLRMTSIFPFLLVSTLSPATRSYISHPCLHITRLQRRFIRTTR